MDRWAELKAEIAELRRRKDRESREARAELRRELNELRDQLRAGLRSWRAALREPELHKTLKTGGFMTRDSRVVERKKYGKRKARRSFQFSKR